MNARHYRTEYDLSALDFPAIEGLGATRIDFRTESPFIVNNKVEIKITKIFLLVDVFNNKEHEVLAAVSVYEIPVNDIKKREDVYECYKDATLGLSDAYEGQKKQLPLPNISFPTIPIEAYQKEIDRVFYLINTLN